MSVVETRKAAKQLKRNKAPKFEDGFYKGVFSLSAIADLQGDTNQGNFVTANQYKTPEKIANGEVGKTSGIVIYETNNEKTEASFSNVYSNFVGGKECAAMIDIAGKGTGLIEKKSDSTDTSNPLNMYSTLGWKVPAFAAKTLNSAWLINIKSYGI
jgi:N4-gp56 family major capsid protein